MFKESVAQPFPAGIPPKTAPPRVVSSIVARTPPCTRAARERWCCFNTISAVQIPPLRKLTTRPISSQNSFGSALTMGSGGGSFRDLKIPQILSSSIWYRARKNAGCPEDLPPAEMNSPLKSSLNRTFFYPGSLPVVLSGGLEAGSFGWRTRALQTRGDRYGIQDTG